MTHGSLIAIKLSLCLFAKFVFLCYSTKHFKLQVATGMCFRDYIKKRERDSNYEVKGQGQSTEYFFPGSVEC